MSAADILILILILAAVAAAVYKLVRNRKAGGCALCGGCSETDRGRCSSCKEKRGDEKPVHRLKNNCGSAKDVL